MSSQATFCTLFDHGYLTRGLALIESLNRVYKGQFQLFVLAMSAECEDILQKLALPQVVVISLKDFESPLLTRLRGERTVAEYCWTVTPSLPLFIFERYPQVQFLSYIDADCYFFANPSPLFEEMGSQSVLIHEHRYSFDRLPHRKTSGRFNVGLVSFRRKSDAMEVLKWWQAKCNEWCFSFYDQGRLGDQLYLDQWPDLFKCVHILQHIGGGVAPWNIWKYQVKSTNQGPTVNGVPLIFFHYHGFRFFGSKGHDPAYGYDFSTEQQAAIYSPYAEALLRAHAQVQRQSPTFGGGIHPQALIREPVSPAQHYIRVAKKIARPAFWKSLLQPDVS